MLFHSLDYVLFLVLAVIGYWALVRLQLFRLVFIFGASCLFYMAWNPAYIVLILASVVLDYSVGRGLGVAERPRARKLLLFCSVGGNLGLLGAFKYYNFFATAVHQTLGLVGLDVTLPMLDVLLPVGISFYTFQTMSYTIDVYRRRIEVEKSLLRFAFYVSFFPQLVAGPIVRASQFLPQLHKKPKLSSEEVGSALFLIATGMVKKLVLADYVAVNLVDRVFDNPEAFTSLEVYVALVGYTLQIYCDFSGYTDIARGSARLLGFDVPENFNKPYMATNPADFWRRWHMTLSSWLRDYLYYPLGGSRSGPARAYFNLWITMFLIGMWHGANWTFVLYGIVHATAMVLHRFAYKITGRTKETVDPTWLRVLKILACLNFVVFARILFRGADVDNAWAITNQLFVGSTSLAQVSWSVWGVLFIGFLSHYLPKGWYDRTQELFVKMPAPAQGVALAGVGAVISVFATTDVVPYIYFQF